MRKSNERTHYNLAHRTHRNGGHNLWFIGGVLGESGQEAYEVEEQEWTPEQSLEPE